MSKSELTRRTFLAGATSATLAACAARADTASADPAPAAPAQAAGPGSQRLSLEQLQKWESLRYGMFVHFGMSTFLGTDTGDGKTPATTYAPDHLDIDQWVSVARDAGMKYMVLTTKHDTGHCLWPSKHTDYTVANSGNKTNVVKVFCETCRKRGILPGLYYDSFDNHHRFGSMTPDDAGSWQGAPPTNLGMNWFPRSTFPKPQKLAAYTTSLYQTFQTAQITELLTEFGPVAEVWVDIPGMLGRGYRTFLYQHIAQLQPQTVVMMNSGISDAATYAVDYAWPSDLIALERNVPPKAGHQKWRQIEGKRYYLPGETCNTIGKFWHCSPGDGWGAKPRSDEALLAEYHACRAGGVNWLLDVPPDQHGLIPEGSVAALMRLRKNAGL